MDHPSTSYGISSGVELPGDRLVRFKEALGITGFESRTSLYALIDKGELPKPIKRGRNRYFLQSDLTAYVAKLAAQRTVEGQS